MGELDEIGIRGIPKGSKLILLGDWYRKSGADWRIVCYFLYQEKETFRKSLPVDLLPTLAAGTTFPRETTEIEKQPWTGTFKLPNQSEWKKLRYHDLPQSLKRANKYSEELENGVVYRFDVDGTIYWLPAIELARMLFSHSSEVTRAAVYQGNTWQLGKSSQVGWKGEVELSSNVPVRYLNSLQFRRFFTWLFFVPEAANSFGSIFSYINRSTRDIDGAERWTFDFIPPDLSNCEISYAGFRDGTFEKDLIYIREIRSLSGVQSPDLETVDFSHPDDEIVLQADESDPDSDDKPNRTNKPTVKINELDPENRPQMKNKRHLIKVGKTGFNFDVELDLRRSPRHVRMLPPGIEPDLDDIQEQPQEEIASLQEGSDQGTGPRADVDNLEQPELIEMPEKMVFFQTMLEQLEEKYGWQVLSQMGDVPKMRCRSAHLVDGRVRQYCHTIVQRDETTTVQILEIELTAEESLSTLFFRASDTDTTYQLILDELMRRNKESGLNAMSWKRKYNSESTAVTGYLGHPEKKIKSEEDALSSWVARAAERIIGL